MPNYLTDDELAHAKSLLDRMTTIFQHTVVGQDGLRRALTASLLAGATSWSNPCPAWQRRRPHRPWRPQCPVASTASSAPPI